MPPHESHHLPAAVISALVRVALRVEHAVGLLIDEAGKQLLRVPEYHGPGENLTRCIQCAKARHELATHEQYAKECSEGADREFKGYEGDR
jgi:hypothetical protein